MGWNFVKQNNPSKLTEGFTEDYRFYFVHSYKVVCDNNENSILKTDHGGEFDSAIQKIVQNKYKEVTKRDLEIDEFTKNDAEEEKKGSTFEDIQRRALGINASADDVVGLQGPLAAQAGFGIGAGLGYSRSN